MSIDCTHEACRYYYECQGEAWLRPTIIEPAKHPVPCVEVAYIGKYGVYLSSVDDDGMFKVLATL